MGTERRKRRLSDQLCERILEGVRFSPVCAQSDLRTDGIHTIGAGGLGYGYWRSPTIMQLHKRIADFREIANAELSYSEVETLVREFLGRFVNPIIAGRFDLQSGNGSLFEKIESESIELLKDEFFDFISDFVAEKQYWLPLNSVDGEAYSGEVFSLLPLKEFDNSKAGNAFRRLGIPTQKNTSSYLGIRARNHTRAIEKSSAVLGAMMLSMHNGTQYVHTMAEPVSDILEVHDVATLTTTSAHVPSLTNPLILEPGDKVWLARMDKILADERANKKVIRALQWMRASWFLKGAERFSTICQAVDAVCPTNLRSMKAKCSWIKNGLSADVSSEAIELLFKKLRSDVAHGDAPALVESPSYLAFLGMYGVDPSHAAFEISRQLIVENFFPDMLIRPNPLTSHPNALRRINEMFARYGMEHVPSAGFNFSVLSPTNNSTA